MLEIASQMILCLLLAALIGAIIGYILGKATCASDDCGRTMDNKTSTTTAATAVAASAASVTATQSNNKATKTTTSKKSADAEALVVNEADAPKLYSSASEGEADNLKRIKGIGPKIEESLNGIGIYYFRQISQWTEKNMQWADAKLAFPGRAKRDAWVDQATLLEKGEETEFSKRVDKGQVSSSQK